MTPIDIRELERVGRDRNRTHQLPCHVGGDLRERDLGSLHEELRDERVPAHEEEEDEYGHEQVAHERAPTKRIAPTATATRLLAGRARALFWLLAGGEVEHVMDYTSK